MVVANALPGRISVKAMTYNQYERKALWIRPHNFCESTTYTDTRDLKNLRKRQRARRLSRSFQREHPGVFLTPCGLSLLWFYTIDRHSAARALSACVQLWEKRKKKEKHVLRAARMERCTICSTCALTSLPALPAKKNFRMKRKSATESKVPKEICDGALYRFLNR